ncbi:MAG TPA: HdeD family acid-resistance protein [Hyphomicrobiaceae bacterium]|nr:HdeD family acid-resistance protein [Hyphomicrobiaceae bacterium]
MVERLSEAELTVRIAEAKAYVAANWGWFLGLGIVLVIAGMAAIAFPLVSTIAAKIFLGWIFLIGGVVLILHAFSASRWAGFALSLLIGILYVLAGGYLAFFPLTGILTLTILLAALFIAEGIAEIVMGVQLRPHGGWGVLIFSGLVAIAAGVLITLGLPDSAEWAIGLLTGINLLVTGWSYIFLGLAARKPAAA